MTDFNMAEVLSEATSLKPAQRETAFTFSRRLIKELAADDFPADKWDTLPDEAQEWVNQQIRLTNENKQVDEVPGFAEFSAEVHPARFKTAVEVEVEVPAQVAANGEDTEIVEEEEEEEEKPKRIARGVRAPKEKAEPKTRDYKTRKNPDGKPSAIMRLKELLIEDGTLTPNQLMQMLEGEGYHISQTTVISCKADFRATVSILQRHGLMNVELVK